MRIAGLVEDRADGEIETGAPGRQDEIDLVLIDQAFQRLGRLFGARAVVILHDLDGNALVAELEATGGIHFLDPQFVIRNRRYRRAARGRAGARDRIADLDRGLCLRLAPTERRRARHHRQTGGQSHCTLFGC